jgi:hypothetical protein
MDTKKQGPTEMQAEVARLQAAGKLPPLHEVLGAVADARAKYREPILKARNSGEENEE